MPRVRIYAAMLPAALAVLLYLPSLTGGLVFDDYQLLAYHPRIFTITVHEAFTTDFWANDPPAWKSMHWRPLALLAYAAVYRVFGIETVAFHAVSIVLNAIAATAFFLFLQGLGYRTRVCLVAATLFAVHPLHVEAVAWITGMIETLAVTLCLISMACFARGWRVISVII